MDGQVEGLDVIMDSSGKGWRNTLIHKKLQIAPQGIESRAKRNLYAVKDNMFLTQF